MNKRTALELADTFKKFGGGHILDETSNMLRNQHVEIELLNKEIESLNEAKQVKSHQLAWIYRGDGEDNLESLTCPVIIAPAKLLEMTQEIADYDEMRADFQKVTLEMHDEITRLQDDKTRLLYQESITYQAIQEQKELIDRLCSLIKGPGDFATWQDALGQERVNRVMIERKATRLETDIKTLGELLAVINGDGGHCQNKYGIEKAVTDAIAKVLSMKTERDNLVGFAKAVMSSWPENDSLQEEALYYGLLSEETRTEPCDSPNCHCKYSNDIIEFGLGVTCYKKTSLINGE